MPFIKDKLFHQREEMRNYIYGLIRYEVAHGDCPIRTEMLSKIYYDLMYVEDLTKAENWKRANKEMTAELELLDNITELKKAISGLQDTNMQLNKHVGELLNICTDNNTKTAILEKAESIKNILK